MQKGSDAGQVIKLRLTCLDQGRTKGDSEQAEVGLQDRQQKVHEGQLQPDGSVVYEVEVTASRQSESKVARLRSPFVHGTPDAPFLYLSWKSIEVGSAPWIRRIKIPLSALTWEQIKGVPEGTTFVAQIAGTGSGTVPLLNGNWTPHDASSSAI